MAELTLNGVRTHVQRLGAGLGADAPAVVFVHGILVDNMASLYFTLANPVSQMARGVLYDLRGHGKSERTASGYSLDQMLDDLRALLDASELDAPVYLVGHSYGGLLALAYAAREPERVAGLALIDPPLPLGNWGDRIASLFTLEGPEREQKLEQAWTSMHGGGASRKLQRIRAVATALVEKTSLMDEMRRSRALTEQEIAAIRCPVLAVYGEESEIIDCADTLARLLPSAEIDRLPGCSHRVLFEDTDSVRSRIVRWLDRQFAQPGA